MVATIVDLWKRDSESIYKKSLEQVLKFSGDGKLKNHTNTGNELRSYFSLLPTKQLGIYIDECLENSFENSGFVLQDLANELGRRLGFQVTHGLYRGNTRDIGYDGLWCSQDHNIVIEVKTTNVYAIDIDTIANYRKRLIETNQISSEKSSILLIVGRNDTGGLEAQIRGSKHAWDIRLISMGAILKLLKLKENLLDDEKTFVKICQVLKPIEYTRLDDLVETIFITGQDTQLVNEMESADDVNAGDLLEEKLKPVSFHLSCISVIEKKIGINLRKQTKTLYDNQEKSVGITCAVSKNHSINENSNYWFAFHPYQVESLKKYLNAYVCFGCGSSETIFLFDYKYFMTLLDKMWMTKNDDREYWHIVIRQQGDHYMLARGEKDHLDITDYLLSR